MHKGRHASKPHRDRSRNTARTASSFVKGAVQQQFADYGSELDTRHDKYERIVKLSRDVTVESKRAIFLLHRLESEESDAILEEANEKLSFIRTRYFLKIARELQGEDPYRFLRAYSPGLQEYIECVSFRYYLLHQKLVPLQLVRDQLRFTATASENTLDEAPAAHLDLEPVESASRVSDTPAEELGDGSSDEEVCVPVPVCEYFLGLADLTGELMRRAINCVGSGNLAAPFELRSFLQSMYKGFNSLGGADREVRRKMSTLKASLAKVEDACYAIKVRGSEIPRHLLTDLFTSTPQEPVDSGTDC